ncbi:MAG: hypothetical protein Q6L60_11255 [Thermostichus sp. HHBFW_bins_43]
MNLIELPAGDLISAGLRDLEEGNINTVPALLVAISSTRLAKAGLVFPKTSFIKEPELALYRHLQQEREDAYSYYNALLRSLDSFCNALETNQYKRIKESR